MVVVAVVAPPVTYHRPRRIRHHRFFFIRVLDAMFVASMVQESDDAAKLCPHKTGACTREEPQCSGRDFHATNTCVR